MCCFFGDKDTNYLLNIHAMIQNQLKNWKIEKYNYFCKNACYEQSTNELEIITVIPFNLMINSNQ